MTERIVSAAIRIDALILSLPAPARHHDVIAASVVATGRASTDQGFLTSTGRYVERDEAKIIARAAGQLLPRASDSRDLFSEDVW